MPLTIPVFRPTKIHLLTFLLCLLCCLVTLASLVPRPLLLLGTPLAFLEAVLALRLGAALLRLAAVLSRSVLALLPRRPSSSLPGVHPRLADVLRHHVVVLVHHADVLVRVLVIARLHPNEVRLALLQLALQAALPPLVRLIVRALIPTAKAR